MMCDYFQARVQQEYVWFVTAVLRGYEYLVFDRTLDPKNSIFEFFVPRDSRETFLALMNIFQNKGFVSQVRELPNRLLVQGVLEPQLFQEPQ